MNKQDIVGRVAIVTGGSSGIGRSICELLGKAGIGVAVVGRNEQRCNEVADGIVSDGGLALPVVADITNPSAVSEMIQKTLDEFGQLDILINNAGIYDNHRLLDVTDEAWFGVLNSSLTGSFLCSREAYRIMKPAGRGHIICIASQAAGWPGPEEIAYGSVKSGQVKFSLHIGMEFDQAQKEASGETSFFSHAICPGGVDTPLQRNLGRSPETLAKFLKASDVSELTLEVLLNPEQGNDYFQQWSEDRNFQIAPQGYFEEHSNVMRIWKD